MDYLVFAMFVVYFSLFFSIVMKLNRNKLRKKTHEQSFLD